MDATKLIDCTKEPKEVKPEWLENLKKYIDIPIHAKYIALPRTEYVQIIVIADE